MALDYDFFIEGLGFNKKITEQMPEERATAQFRKEQFDSTPTVGDQSLTGWWTRGQLSFHGGAGTKFYEISESSDLLNTYGYAEGLVATTTGWAYPEVDPYRFALFANSDWKVMVEAPDDDADGKFVGVSSLGFVYAVNDDGTGQQEPAFFGINQERNWCVKYPIDGLTYFVSDDHGVESYDGTTLTQTWTHGGAGNPVKIWYAKERVFIVSNTGHWWGVDPAATGGNLDTTNAFWASGKPASAEPYTPNDNNWCLSDSPGAVFAAYGNRVYAFVLDDSGLLPTVNVGVVVAQLPSAERINDIRYSMGKLVLATSRGVRVAAVQADGASLVMGPLAPEMRVAYSVEAWGDVMYATGMARISSTQDACRLVQIDLARYDPQTGTCPYHFMWRGGSQGEVGMPVTVRAMDSALWMYYSPGLSGATIPNWADSFGGGIRECTPEAHLWTATERNQDKNLTTGLHRLGTIDEKHFSSITIRCDPTPDAVRVQNGTYRQDGSGTITVYAVQQDGTETLLGSVDGSTTGGELDIDIRAEALAFKFVFETDEIGRFPYLAGYQLKALPVPKRQRMKRVPLMLFDREQNRIGQEMGNDGSAWTRLLALEALEEANAVVAFEDKETGETGSAYIESVEMRRTAPTSRHGDGFGGTIWLTLRVI